MTDSSSQAPGPALGPCSPVLTGSGARAALPALDALGFPFALVLTQGGRILVEAGEVDTVFPFASVTKPIVAWSALVAAERGMLDLDAGLDLAALDALVSDDPVAAAAAAGGHEPGQAGTGGGGPKPLQGDSAPANPARLAPTGLAPTARHLLAHASGVAPDSADLLAAPGSRRIYSNRGYELLGRVLAEATAMPVSAWVETSVLEPLGMASVMVEGSAAHSGEGTARDLALFAAELAAPRLISSGLAREACQPAFPGLDGVLPGYGRQSPNDFGLGLEVRGRKHPHWTGAANSPQTFGHFGQSGSFLWVDPVAGRQAVFLGSKPFGAVHQEVWPRLSDQVLGLTDVASVRF
ncbi:class A beta-lactamase-related serine hydrolase [Actinomyces sp. 2119]|uniref:Class A beta-lactamase-related serine hydrolase n=2 Tax=Actinomycetaceae TaxID=2049 RepID=A0ABM6Z1P5_9ACTO|nr:class A beta-lactamase-related serine hydrolase [Actinomyces lilanjuaniae]RJF40485.1 class A beta-lactamase-related serine hydrolase [Actinomyces sp. 2119]RJF41854.1 class A beta-lactamase-related serine hydrolase [Actinomyces sp. 2119]